MLKEGFASAVKGRLQLAPDDLTEGCFVGAALSRVALGCHRFVIAVFQNKEDENDDEQGLRGDDGEGNLA